MKNLYIDFGNTNIKFVLGEKEVKLSSNDFDAATSYLDSLLFDQIIIVDSIHKNYKGFLKYANDKYRVILARDIIFNTDYINKFNTKQIEYIGTDIMLGAISKIDQYNDFIIVDSGTLTTVCEYKNNIVEVEGIYVGNYFKNDDPSTLFENIVIDNQTKKVLKKTNSETFIPFIESLKNKYRERHLFLTGGFFKNENLVIEGLKKITNEC